MKKRRYPKWVAIGLICLAFGIYFSDRAGITAIFRSKSARDLAVEFSYGTDQKQRDDAARALEQLGSTAVPALVEMLRADPPFYQPFLVELAYLAPTKQQDALLRNVKLVGASGLRLSAARALAHLGPKAHAAIPDLANAIHDPDLLLAYAAMRALGKTGGDAFPILTNALSDVDPELRRYAASSLGLMGTNAISAVPLLTLRLNDPSDIVGFTASQTLQHFQKLGVSIPTLNYSVTTAQQIAANEYLETRRAALPALFDFACEQRDPKVLPVLTASLGDPDAVLREWAARGLSKMGACGRNAVPILTSLLVDREHAVRVAVTNALTEIHRSLDLGEQPCAAIPEANPTALETGVRA